MVPNSSNCVFWKDRFCVLVVQLPLNQKLLTSLPRLGLEVKQQQHLELDFTSWWKKTLKNSYCINFYFDTNGKTIQQMESLQLRD